MATQTIVWAAPANITITLASLAASATVGRECLKITTAGALDVAFTFAIKLQAGTPAAGAALQFYLGESSDGTIFTGNMTGTNAALTLRSPTNLWNPPGATFYTPTLGGLTWNCTLQWSALFGSLPPPYIGIVVINNTGIALSATEGDHTKNYSLCTGSIVL